MEKLNLHSPDFTQANIEKLAELFPNCVTETRAADGTLKKAIDFDLLKQELSTSIVEGPQERYQLNWPGKREALLTANAPIAKTLKPCREESVDFDTTQNLYIEGDNLDALKLLQETYLGKVKMIYIDPPYNTGSDFIYHDEFNIEKNLFDIQSGVKDEEGYRLIDQDPLSQNSEANGRFHSDWMNMMYPRLKLARNLLSDDGVIFISIDDHEQANLKRLCDEVLGEDSFITTLHVHMSTVQGQKVSAAKSGNIVKNAEYILVYSKTGRKNIARNVLYDSSSYDTHYSIYLKPDGINYFEEPLSNFIISNPQGRLIAERFGLVKKDTLSIKNIALL